MWNSRMRELSKESRKVSLGPNYGRVLAAFLRNSLVREMTFRGNFLIQVVTRVFWFVAQLTLFEIIYRNVGEINGWAREEYFAFMGTGMLINAIVETLFMPNCANFSELIRTGNLDFALLKPIDTQFLVSFEKANLAMLNQISFGQVAIYVVYVAVAVTFFYSLMISLACTSIWFGRNQGLYDFWFYITVFARYPRSIYDGVDPSRLEAGEVLQFGFSYVIPILVVVTVPARVLVKSVEQWQWAAAALAAAIVGLAASRVIFRRALRSYRSASS